MLTRLLSAAATMAVLLAASVATAQTAPAPAAPATVSSPHRAPDVGAQQQAIAKLSFLDGVWAGPAWILLPDGTRTEVWQTERIGSFLDGGLKLIEGRGYDAGGATRFNAFAVISYDDVKGAYAFRSYAHGHASTFPFQVRPDGYVWEVPMGPATLRYTATVTGDRLREVGERIVPGGPTLQVFEMNLRRVGSTDWPAAGQVPAAAGR